MDHTTENGSFPSCVQGTGEERWVLTLNSTSLVIEEKMVKEKTFFISYTQVYTFSEEIQ